MPATLGEQIRHARNLKGMTQEQLAAAVGAKKRSVGNWERDETVPRNIPRLESVLGVQLRADGGEHEPEPDERLPAPTRLPTPDQGESLQTFVRRHMDERGFENPHQLALAAKAEKKAWSYEIVRQIVNDGHHAIKDRTVKILADTLRVSENEVRAAAGLRLRGVPFELPPEAAELSQAEREVMRLVLKAMLGRYREADAGDVPQPLHPRQHLPTARVLEIPAPDLDRVAAHRGRSRGKEQVQAQDEDAERPE